MNIDEKMFSLRQLLEIYCYHCCFYELPALCLALHNGWQIPREVLISLIKEMNKKDSEFANQINEKLFGDPKSFEDL